MDIFLFKMPCRTAEQTGKTLDWLIHCTRYLIPFTCPWNWKPHTTNIKPSKDQNEWEVAFEVCGKKIHSIILNQMLSKGWERFNKKKKKKAICARLFSIEDGVRRERCLHHTCQTVDMWSALLLHDLWIQTCCLSPFVCEFSRSSVWGFLFQAAQWLRLSLDEIITSASLCGTCTVASAHIDVGADFEAVTSLMLQHGRIPVNIEIY